MNDEKIRELAKKFKEDPSVEVKFSTVFNLSPCKPPTFFAQADYQDYLTKDIEGKREYFEQKAKIVNFSEEFQLADFRSKCMYILKKSLTDPELRGYWKYKISDVDGQSTSARILGQRTVAAFGNDDGFENEATIQIPKSLEQYAKMRAYKPPPNRILVTSNLTFNNLDVLPVFSDVAGETLENMEVHDTMLFEYADVNKIYGAREPELAAALKLSRQRENLIACDCCSAEPIVPCYENPKCMCYRVNSSLVDLQGERGDLGYTEFSTFKPILFTKATNTYFENAGFACSDACACKGRCTNNSLFMIEKRIFPLELYRYDLHIGFGIRTLAMIPAGTPVMEFVGELTELQNMRKDSHDYAYQVSYPDHRKFWDVILDLAEWTDEYAEALEEISHKTYFVNPKFYGNVGRTALHSCTANMELVRVFQKGLSPAHARLVLVTLDNIYPGTPLTLDYGPAYVREQLQDACRCDSFACLNGEFIKKVKRMDFVQIGECFQNAANEQFRSWKTEIYDKSLELARELKKKEKVENERPS